MKGKLSKLQLLKETDLFFSKIRNKSPSEIKKIKRLAMGKNIKLGRRKRLFCKKCLNPYKIPKTKIRRGIKTVICENCGYKSRWKIRVS